MGLKTDYVYGIPVFKFSRMILGDEADVFISGGYHDHGEGLTPPAFFSSTIDTITEYYDSIEELRETKKGKKSWAV